MLSINNSSSALITISTVFLLLGLAQISPLVSSFTINPTHPVSNEELSVLTENLFSLEGPNNAADLVTINTDDVMSPLLKVNPAAYKKPTIAKLLRLYNNYSPNVKDAELLTAEESREEEDFLDAVISTPIMQKTQEFLFSKGFISPSNLTSNRSLLELQQPNFHIGIGNENNNSSLHSSFTTTQRAFHAALHEIWFKFYSRNRGTLGSSGFEHVFLGETKKGKVSGLHNWVFFNSEESQSNARYDRHLHSLKLGSKGSIIKLKFNWLGKIKPVSSMFVGTSPELELALYTVCFYTRPQRRCSVVLNGNRFNIQTYVMNAMENGTRLVASAYPEI